MSRDHELTLSKEDQRKRKAEELRKLSEQKGFTKQYQEAQKEKEKEVSHKRRAPATDRRYASAVEWWQVWMISKNEREHKYFTKDQPDPPIQELKLFPEAFIVGRKGDLPSQGTVLGLLHCFFGEWERQMERKISKEVKSDCYNYIKNDLTIKYGLPVEKREKHLVTCGDLDILLRRLWIDDDHDYPHERSRIQESLALSLFSASGARAGSVVESSSYRGTNECLYYGHLTFGMQWVPDMDSEQRELTYWVSIDPKFLKGHRYDGKKAPKPWIPEQEILGRNLIFWIIVVGIADKAFKGIETIEELLDITPPDGRSSWELKWAEHALKLPVLRMVTSVGPDGVRALTFASMRHNNSELRKRCGFEHELRVHGIRGTMANVVDPMASEATRSQALDHENPDTFLEYQARLKRIDMQAAFWKLAPDYTSRDMEESMIHHMDRNAPQQLDAAALAELYNDPKMIAIIDGISRMWSRSSSVVDTRREVKHVIHVVHRETLPITSVRPCLSRMLGSLSIRSPDASSEIMLR